MCSDKQSAARLRVRDQNKNDSSSNDDKTIEEIEREASKKVASRLLFSWNLQDAISKTAWAFVLIGFLLNLFGYDYVFNQESGTLRIDTIENKHFQQELVQAGYSKEQVNEHHTHQVKMTIDEKSGYSGRVA
jgi:hypothetical protein|mmetsp:Transcript_9766/g.17795  ORF Transcript_9766/g.17795 Transcript_9766/m.17795 type:complete len:132 (+) Transcript_9766:1135-1530(+)